MLYASQDGEIGNLGAFVDLTNVAVGLVVLFFGFRIASGLSLSSQRLAARFVLATVGLWVLAEVVEGVHC